MQSLLFLQSCSLPALSFFKCLLMAYSPACVLPLPFPPNLFPTIALQQKQARVHLVSKETILSKTSKRKGCKNTSFPKPPKSKII